MVVNLSGWKEAIFGGVIPVPTEHTTVQETLSKQWTFQTHSHTQTKDFIFVACAWEEKQLEGSRGMRFTRGAWIYACKILRHITEDKTEKSSKFSINILDRARLTLCPRKANFRYARLAKNNEHYCFMVSAKRKKLMRWVFNLIRCLIFLPTHMN